MRRPTIALGAFLALASALWPGDRATADPCVVSVVVPQRLANATEALQVCTKAALDLPGIWVGQWRTLASGKKSVCDIRRHGLASRRSDGVEICEVFAKGAGTGERPAQRETVEDDAARPTTSTSAPKTAAELCAGRTSGVVPDGRGGSVICGPAPTPAPKTAAELCAGRTSGIVPDGRGGSVSCGPTPAPAPKTAAELCAGLTSGVVPDGRGGSVICGPGPTPAPKTTAELCAGRTSGVVPDGRGGSVSCGPGPTPAPKTAAELCAGRTSGVVPDGRGGSVSCGPGPTPAPKTTAELCAGRTSGVVPDGRGGSVSCGAGPSGACYATLNGPNPWLNGASKTYPAEIARTLCNSAETSPKPAECFHMLMSGRIAWDTAGLKTAKPNAWTRWEPLNAANACRGATTGVNLATCVESRVAAQKPWFDAVRMCREGHAR